MYFNCHFSWVVGDLLFCCEDGMPHGLSPRTLIKIQNSYVLVKQSWSWVQVVVCRVLSPRCAGPKELVGYSGFPCAAC